MANDAQWLRRASISSFFRIEDLTSTPISFARW
jgi:hypothetical protein